MGDIVMGDIVMGDIVMGDVVMGRVVIAERVAGARFQNGDRGRGGRKLHCFGAGADLWGERWRRRLWMPWTTIEQTL